MRHAKPRHTGTAWSVAPMNRVRRSVGFWAAYHHAHPRTAKASAARARQRVDRARRARASIQAAGKK
ncbi:MAG: hypothetical protein NTX64_09050 [Elusimicrobia bacterium]|nr:hypothetical protein [Elusimicrobiota bacterium]